MRNAELLARRDAFSLHGSGRLTANKGRKKEDGKTPGGALRAGLAGGFLRPEKRAENCEMAAEMVANRIGGYCI